jgi:hypothetical protein
MSGLWFGAAFEVRYHVRAPRNAVIRLTNTNGAVSATATSGKLIARTTNGGIRVRSRAVEAEAQTQR